MLQWRKALCSVMCFVIRGPWSKDRYGDTLTAMKHKQHGFHQYHHNQCLPFQISRLQQCEKMLVALELAGWLNEASLSLQAVIQSYGLLAPLLHFKIPSIPVMQVLERCMVVLLEIPANLRQKRMASISESLHHMTACLTYHMAKVFVNQKLLMYSRD